MGGLVSGVLGCLDKILQSARPIPALLKVHGQLCRNLASSTTIDRRSVLCDALVKKRAAQGRYQLVGHVLVENVNKTMLSSDGSVRQFYDPGRGEELMPLR